MVIDADVVERTPLDADGVSGAALERVTLRDGRVRILKVIDLETDWLMRATGDDGRLFRLWRDGTLDRLPRGIDCTIESVDAFGDGWRVAMHDASASLVPPGQQLSRSQGRLVLAAVSELHRAFTGTHLDGLCPLVDRLAFLTPTVARSAAPAPLRAMVLEGWTRFAETAPRDVGTAVLELTERPGKLAAVLGTHPETLLHGDLKVANIGFDGRRVVLLDWGTLTGMGPPALDFAWYLAVNSAAIDATLDEVLVDLESTLGPDDRDALPLALLAQMLQLGWEKALGATSDNPATRAREAPGFAWWCERASAALERWSPV